MKKKQYQSPTMLVVKISGKESFAGMDPSEGPAARETLHRESEWEE